MKRLKTLEINGFKSFQKKTVLDFQVPIVCIVGPNGSGKSNVVEAVRFVLGEQSMKSMRGKQGADLIFKGSKNLPKSSRAYVSIYFNNSDKVFKLPDEEGKNASLGYDTVSISREVYPDGVNKYILNGGEARLKDVNSLLSSVNIGSSGHHIISQGEADRILSVNPKERKEMVEDALGLKIYQYKIRETERKLERTGENMKEVAMLRKENAPHLRFLQKQMEKAEKARDMRVELLSLYKEYLKKESAYLEKESGELTAEKRRISSELEVLRKKIAGTEEKNISEEENMKELGALERRSAELRKAKGELERKLGRLEGILEMEKERAKTAGESRVLSPEAAEEAIREIDFLLEEADGLETLSEIRAVLERMRSVMDDLRRQSGPEQKPDDGKMEELEKSRKEISEEIEKMAEEEEEAANKAEELRKENREKLEKLREAEKERFGLRMKEQELSSALELLSVREENLVREKGDFENEIREGAPLVGQEIMSYKHSSADGEDGREYREEMRKKIERIKIKLEDAGAGGAEIEKEFKEATERDQFLEKEMEDLSESIKSLEALMADLKNKIDLEFKEGIKKINAEFQKFFELMFGGGTASLKVVVENRNKNRRNAEEEEEEIAEEEEESEPEQGIEISVSLPHKKVRELHALSGGERSLTSIALLFAMSQVNPPPFLILDETDAALDEANSRKYGDMLEKLSSRSQLIVVTHNRETMSRAGILYGVTIGGDGGSKLLSVKFDEAVAIAK